MTKGDDFLYPILVLLAQGSPLIALRWKNTSMLLAGQCDLLSLDIRKFISLEDVAEEMDYGPNGGLIFCMEYLLENLEWLKDQFDEIGSSDDEYFIVDCPGQIELFTHNPVMISVHYKQNQLYC